MKQKPEVTSQKSDHVAPSSVLRPPSSDLCPLTADLFRAILRAELAAPTVSDRILTTAEAMAYAKHDSESAFYRWCSRWSVTSSAAGRYARSRLDTALDRESAKRRPARCAPRRTEDGGQKTEDGGQHPAKTRKAA